MKLVNLCAAFVISSLFAMASSACPAHEKCKAIKDPVERLKCFDRIKSMD